MEQGITWYDALGVLPGAETRKLKREYEAEAGLLRPDMIAGARSNVVQAVTRGAGPPGQGLGGARRPGEL
jgi:hypothetical protein